MGDPKKKPFVCDDDILSGWIQDMLNLLWTKITTWETGINNTKKAWQCLQNSTATKDMCISTCKLKENPMNQHHVQYIHLFKISIATNLNGLNSTSCQDVSVEIKKLVRSYHIWENTVRFFRTTFQPWNSNKPRWSIGFARILDVLTSQNFTRCCNQTPHPKKMTPSCTSVEWNCVLQTSLH